MVVGKRTRSMNAQLTKALQSPVDYSAEFSEKVKKIRDQISEELGTEVGLDSDMNYRAGQRIVVRFNDELEPIAWQDSLAVIDLSVFISSRASYHTYLLRRLEKPSFDFAKLGLPQPKDVWNTVTAGEETWPKAAMTVIDSVMKKNSYVRLERSELSQVVDGKFTDLDGKPASMFEVLFSEID